MREVESWSPKAGSDAPVHYRAAEAEAWAAGYNAAVEDWSPQAGGNLRAQVAEVNADIARLRAAAEANSNDAEIEAAHDLATDVERLFGMLSWPGVESPRAGGDTVTVWVMPHDDPEVVWIVNDERDMEGNWTDLHTEGIDAGSLQEYLDTWTRLEMPAGLYRHGSREAINAWVEAHVDGEG
jgi:hypothetical protein